MRRIFLFLSRSYNESILIKTSASDDYDHKDLRESFAEYVFNSTLRIMKKKKGKHLQFELLKSCEH